MFNKFIYPKILNDEPEFLLRNDFAINDVPVEFSEELTPQEIGSFLDWFNEQEIVELVCPKYFSRILLNTFCLKDGKMVFIDIRSENNQTIKFLKDHIREQSIKNRQELENLNKISRDFLKTPKAKKTAEVKTAEESIIAKDLSREEKMQLFLDGLAWLKRLNLPVKPIYYRLFNSAKSNPELEIMRAKYLDLMKYFHPDRNRSASATENTKSINTFWNSIQ